MGKGMMGRGMMGKGMMGKGMMGKGMMGKGMMGKGMMPMMMNGCRMNSMMMGGGMMPMMGNPSQTADYLKNYKKFQKFFNETRNQRKKLNDLQFEYGEARWNPNTTLGELQRMRVRLNKLRQKIYAKRPQ
ncbi:Zinc resistance-associated protein [hydrothermal vent metagenome]|uniref:Zinc resistance-associated protein n=1 Tax=hydrothermal vent metagenome TaxID=652676 RepID=A0A3B0VLW1_9ZZZZ